MTTVIGKYGQVIDTQKAGTSKLKNLLAYIEGKVYRNSDDKTKKALIDLLPNEYDLILDELEYRKAKPYPTFHWLETLPEKEDS